MEASEPKRLRQLEDENRKLKQMVADQALDLQTLREIVKDDVATVPENRAATEYAVSAHETSERRACRLTGLSQSTRQYRRRRAEPEGLRNRLIELATERLRFGSPRLRILLGREGSKVNRNRVNRRYSQEGLKIRVNRHRKFVAMKRGTLAPPGRSNERWSLDSSGTLSPTVERFEP